MLMEQTAESDSASKQTRHPSIGVAAVLFFGQDYIYRTPSFILTLILTKTIALILLSKVLSSNNVELSDQYLQERLKPR